MTDPIVTGTSRPLPSNGTDDTLTDIIISNGCSVLAELRDLSKLGWKDDSLDRHFARQRERNSHQASKEDEMYWLKTMQKSMAEMDGICDFVPKARNAKFDFLDLGCAPGGYSSRVLQKNKDAHGTGVCLAVEDGGHAFLLPARFKDRYTVHFEDITAYDIFSEGSNAGREMPFAAETFGLVILDGHMLHTREYEWQTASMLLLSQVLIGLKVVEDGGTIFLKLSKLTGPVSARILFLLDTLSTSLQTVKPNTCHGPRKTFYVVAKGIQHGPLLEQYIDKLKTLRNYFIHDLDYAKDHWDEIWDAVVPIAEIKAMYIPRLTELGLPVWEVHRTHLKKFLVKTGVLKEMRRPLILSPANRTR